MTIQDRPRSPPRQSDSDLNRLAVGSIEKLRGIPDALRNIDTSISNLATQLACLCDLLNKVTIFRGTWSASNTYHKAHQIFKEGWLAWSNTDNNTDDPEPQLSGNRRWLTGKSDFTAWANSGTAVTNTLLNGIRLTTPAEQLYLRYGIRTFIPPGAAGLELSVWVVSDPLGTPDMRRVVPPIMLDGTHENTVMVFPLGSDLLAPNLTADVLVIFASLGSAVTFTGDWDAKRKNDRPPSEGEVNHGSNQARGSAFHFQSKDGPDFETELSLLNPGDQITEGGNDYEISAVDVETLEDYVNVETVPHLRPSEALRTYSFERYGPATIPTRDDGSQWGGQQVNAMGLYSESGYDNVTMSDVMYNVDLEVEDASVSPNWFIQAFTG